MDSNTVTNYNNNSNSNQDDDKAMELEDSFGLPVQTPEQIQQKVEELVKEADKVRQMHEQLEQENQATAAAQEEIDKRSIYVGNVDYETAAEELQAHFQDCGAINRVTILADKFTGRPKGHAYVEFADAKSVENALILSGTLFRNRMLQVTAKRTNIPGYNRRGRGGGARGASSRGAYRGRGGRSRGGGYRGGRGGGRGGYAPY
ncbi:hypothetical protein MP228_006554 [Amoeboaphelidium protococcarum]|nr:hypothetical protein MP228_006554 [Amoeboaphelidium protococcarum]